MVQTEIHTGCWCDHDRPWQPVIPWLWTTGMCEDHRNAVP